MTSVSGILKAYQPVMKEIEARARKNEGTALDHRIRNIVTALGDVRSAGGSLRVDEFKAVNTHVSRVLTLSDYQASLQCSKKAADKIIRYLDLVLCNKSFGRYF